MKEVVGTLVGWPRHLVKPILDEVITIVMDTNIIDFVKWLLKNQLFMFFIPVGCKEPYEHTI